MTNKLMYKPNDDTKKFPFCRLQLVVETIGHSTKLTNQSSSITVLRFLLSQRLRKDFGD